MTKQLTKFAYSRIKARKIMKQKYPDLFKNMGHLIVVHHKDGNPLNNDFSNLEVKSKPGHIIHHANLNKDKVILRNLKKLDLLLMDYNQDKY